MLKKLQKAAGILLMLCALFGGLDAFAQNRTINGKVVDTSGQPVVGAAVMVVGNTKIGTATDMNGAFTLSVPAGANLSIESIGYKSQTVAVGSQSTFDIVLEEDAELLTETVVIGYGVQKKSDITGAIASVKDSDLENRTSIDVAQALQGKAAGVQIVNASGAPGAASSIQIRGYSSNSKTSPLMIVDGLKVNDISYLDPVTVSCSSRPSPARRAAAACSTISSTPSRMWPICRK